MRSLEDRDRERTGFLLGLYELSDGEPMNRVNIKEVGQRLGIEKDDATNLYHWLSGRGLVEMPTLGGDVQLTVHGMDEAERLLREGSSIPTSLLVLSAQEQRAVEAFLTNYRRAESADEIPLVGEEFLEAEAEVRTMEAQLQSPKPKRRVIRAALRELHGLFHGAAGSGLWTALQKVVTEIG